MMKPVAALLLFAAAAFAQEVRPVQCRFLSFACADSLSSVITLSNKGARDRMPAVIDRPLPENHLLRQGERDCIPHGWHP